MSKIRWIVSLSLLGFTPALVLADDHKGGGQSRLEALDSNADGVVSYAEFMETVREIPAEADTDGDGALSLNEFLAARPDRPRGFGNRGGRRGGQSGADGGQPEISEEEREQRRAEREAAMTEQFGAMDEDGNSVLTADEVQAAQFDRMDRNADMELSADELRRPGRGSKGGRRGRGRPDGQIGGQSPQN